MSTAPADFARDGHALRRALLPRTEVEAFATAVRRAVFERAGDQPPLVDRSTYGKAFIQVENIWTHDPDVARFVLDERLAGAAAALLGAEAVRVYHDQALFKEPGGGPTPHHQDQGYWPLQAPDGWPAGAPFTVTMWMPLVDVSAEMGSLSFASGSHRLGSLGDHLISDDSEQVFTALLAERGLPRMTYGALAAGDATFHAGWTVHAAGANPTDRMREVMTVIYVADGARVAEPVTDPQRRDHVTFLGGLPPGSQVGDPTNPRGGGGSG